MMASNLAPRPFGRSGHDVSPLWYAEENGLITIGDWVGLKIAPPALDRRGETIVRDQLAAVGHARVDVLVVTGIVASDIKSGWPLHRLQRMRESGLCRYVIIETSDALEAEWIAANAPVHGVIVHYTPADMAIRYRAFESAHHGGVAIIVHADTAYDAAFALATPEICSVILPKQMHDVPLPIVSTSDVDVSWASYQQDHPAPPKLRSGHPPDAGV